MQQFILSIHDCALAFDRVAMMVLHSELLVKLKRFENNYISINVQAPNGVANVDNDVTCTL